MRTINTFAIGMAVANIALGVMNGDSERVITFCALLVGLLVTRRWING